MVDLQVAALLCSRLCHDLVGPVGALSNGLEILAEEEDEEMRVQATLLLGDSVGEAARRLQFFRIAFGAGGSGTTLMLGEARKAAMGLFQKGRVSLDWPEDTDLGSHDKRRVKLVLNLLLLGAQALPRGGVLSVTAEQLANGAAAVTASGPAVRLDAPCHSALTGDLDPAQLDSQTVVAWMAAMLARDLGWRLTVAEEREGRLALRAGMASQAA